MQKNSINVIGDSISHGANCPDIPNQSYVSLIKNRIAEKTGVYNYGFVSLADMLYNNLGTYQEIHKIENVGFDAARDSNYINVYRLTASDSTAYLNISVLHKFSEAYLYYHRGEECGTFDILVGGETVAQVNCGDGIGMAVYGPIDISGSDSAVITVRVTSDGKPVNLAGMAYYNDTKNIAVNNYSMNGSSLIEYSDGVLDKIFNAHTVIFSLGHNDSYYDSPTIEIDFTAKINTVIGLVKKYGTRLYVNDFCWFSDPKTNHFKLELKRLARECGAVYTDYASEIPDFTENCLSDWAHPNVEGHSAIAELLLSRFDILTRDIEVTFDANGGKALSAPGKTVSFGLEYGDLPKVKRSGYSFAGWCTEPSGGTTVTDSTIVANGSDHTLYARWEKSHAVRNTMIGLGAIAVAAAATGAGMLLKRKKDPNA